MTFYTSYVKNQPWKFRYLPSHLEVLLLVGIHAHTSDKSAISIPVEIWASLIARNEPKKALQQTSHSKMKTLLWPRLTGFVLTWSWRSFCHWELIVESVVTCKSLKLDVNFLERRNNRVPWQQLVHKPQLFTLEIIWISCRPGWYSKSITKKVL
jgi:hypothetical protein